MTPSQYQLSPLREKHELYLKSNEGREFLNTLGSLNPAFPTSECPHLFAKGVGLREGFELCMRAIVSLSIAPKIQTEVEANYGVPDAKK